MARRTSIYVEGFSHSSPIPSACRLGNLLISGGIYGMEPHTGRLSASLEEQCAQMFANLRTTVEAGGGSVDDIVKVNVWMMDPTQKQVLNRYWQELFPDPASRPARQTFRTTLEHGMLVQCDFIAVIRDEQS